MSRDKKRIPEKVQDAIGEDTKEIHLMVPSGLSYPSKPEFVGNGVILHNSRRTHVFGYIEMLEIIKGEHDRYRTDVELGDGDE